jgi:hypothetical protein
MENNKFLFNQKYFQRKRLWWERIRSPDWNLHALFWLITVMCFSSNSYRDFKTDCFALSRHLSVKFYSERWWVCTMKYMYVEYERFSRDPDQNTKVSVSPYALFIPISLCQNCFYTKKEISLVQWAQRAKSKMRKRSKVSNSHGNIV